MNVCHLRPSKGRNPKYPWVIEEHRNVVVHADRTTFTMGRRWYFLTRKEANEKLDDLVCGVCK